MLSYFLNKVVVLFIFIFLKKFCYLVYEDKNWRRKVEYFKKCFINLLIFIDGNIYLMFFVDKILVIISRLK